MARLALSVLALCLALTILLPKAFSEDKYRKGGNKIDNGDDDDEREREAIWLFHFGPVDSREEYLNPLTGEVNGFHVDVLNSLCEIADKNCEIVYDRSSNCWDNIDGYGVGGFGLFNFYYDVCTAWFPTVDRLRTFKFSYSFSQNQGSGFIVPDGNDGNFSPTDLTGKTIGFIRGFFPNPGCIQMQGEDAITGSVLTEDQIVFYDGVEQLKAAVLDGREIDAAFDWGSNYAEDDPDFENLNVDSEIECAAGGPAMMMRKDSRALEWLDEAVHYLLESDKYQEICDRIETEHGHKAGANKEDICLQPAK